MKKAILIFLLLAGTATTKAQTSKTDSTQIRATIMSFYNWYLKNHAKLNSFKLYRGIKVKDAPPYRINWTEANRYFSFIRSSVPGLGEAFIAGQKVFLQQCDSAFRVDTEDEIPYGFDYDWYTNSQEDAGYLVDELKKAKQWATTVHGTEANVDVLGSFLNNGVPVETVIMCYIMKREKGKWKIAGIGCPDYSK
jgi:hypothetical protein